MSLLDIVFGRADESGLASKVACVDISINNI